jgi:hypothetical protein
MATTTVYHYTTGRALSGIATAGVVLREGEIGNSAAVYAATFHVFPFPKSVWLTREKEMPFTAFPSLETTTGGEVNAAQAVAHDPNRYQRWVAAARGVYRLQFYAETIGAVRYWGGPNRAILEKHGTVRMFERMPKEFGDDLRAWYHCYEAIPLQHCNGVEKWVGGEWVPHTSPELERFSALKVAA